MEPTETVTWQTGRGLLEEAFNDVYAGIQPDGTPLAGVMTVARYSMLYTTVYKMCMQRPPREYSRDLYEFVDSMARRYAIPPGKRRHTFIEVFSHLCKCLDHSAHRRALADRSCNVARMMGSAMNEVIADRHRARWDLRCLREGFKSWACNEELLGPTHVDGGAAKGRMCAAWDAGSLSSACIAPV